MLFKGFSKIYFSYYLKLTLYVHARQALLFLIVPKFQFPNKALHKHFEPDFVTESVHFKY